ncbi:reverse transcriptase domain-containing protein [Tanacetum coccineum]
MLKVGKQSHLIKELKQSNGKDHAKAAKKGETSGKEKPLAILMVQPWQRVAKQRITQTFSPESVISFLPLKEEDGTEGPMIIKAKMGGHFVHHMYVDIGSFLEILFEHCFNRFHPEVRSQMVSATTPLVAIPIQRNHRKPKSKENTTVPSTAHGMLKFSVTVGTVTLRSSRIIPLECTMVSGPGMPQPVINQVTEEKIQKELKEKSIDEKEVLAVVEEEGHTWMTPIYEYLTEDIILEEKRKARAIHRKAGEIISDNEKQFRDNLFKDWCEKLCICQCFTSVKHPQANGLVERENMSLGEGIKARLDERSKNWLEEILHVLWAHRTMIKSSNEETTFSLTYGTEAVIPVEIGLPTSRTAKVDMIKN